MDFVPTFLSDGLPRYGGLLSFDYHISHESIDCNKNASLLGK
jgi:hypothetical protein